MRRAAPLLLAAALSPGCGSDSDGTSSSSGTPDAGACMLAPPALADTRLRADGTRLRDALGRTVVLRGVNAGGRSKFAPFAPFDFPAGGYDAALDAYLDRAASWGINTLRVPFTWAAVEPVQGMDDAAYLDRYEAILKGAWKRGMYTIVDFHQDIYAEVFCGDGFPAWTVPDPKPAPHHDCADWSSHYFSDAAMMAAFDAFWAPGSPVQASYAALWDRLSARFKDTPGVIGFELINEPGWGTADLATFEATTLGDFYTTMIARVRQTAPDTLVFFDATGPDAGISSTSLVRPKGEGLVFAPHYYQLGALNGGGGFPGSVLLALTKWRNQGNSYDVPVLLGEFGVTNPTPDNVAYMTAHYDALDALGLSATQWEYSTAAELWNAEDLSLVRADGTENPIAEAIVRPFARAVAGEDASFAYDSKTRGFTLGYTKASGVTEISMPARLYPKGYEVKVKGGCADASQAGVLLVQGDAGAAKVEVVVTAR